MLVFIYHAGPICLKEWVSHLVDATIWAEDFNAGLTQLDTLGLDLVWLIQTDFCYFFFCFSMFV